MVIKNTQLNTCWCRAAAEQQLGVSARPLSLQRGDASSGRAARGRKLGAHRAVHCPVPALDALRRELFSMNALCSLQIYIYIYIYIDIHLEKLIKLRQMYKLFQ